jgi:hypothetical protein
MAELKRVELRFGVEIDVSDLIRGLEAGALAFARAAKGLKKLSKAKRTKAAKV